MIKACIFDMDGTTVDSVKSIAYYLNDTLKKYGYDVVPEEKINYFAGKGPRKLVENAFEYVGADKNCIDAFVKDYLSAYHKDSCYLSAAFEGIVPMLESMKKLKIKTAIISNKQDESVQSISKELFGDLIDVCVGATEDIPLKPDPTSLIDVMKNLGVQKDEVLYVGDTDVDMITAKNAGVKSVGVLWGFRDKDELVNSGADYIVTHPSEITALAKELQ